LFLFSLFLTVCVCNVMYTAGVPTTTLVLCQCRTSWRVSLSLSRGESQSLYTTPLLLLLTETNNNDHKTQGDLYSFLLEPKYPKKRIIFLSFLFFDRRLVYFYFIFVFHSVCLSANVGNKSFIFGLAVNLIFRVTQTFWGKFNLSGRSRRTRSKTMSRIVLGKL
jgi:hypothetical protein